MESLSLNDVSMNVQKIIRPYLEKILTIHSDNITNVTLYGPSVDLSPESKPEWIHLLFIFQDLDFRTLKNISDLFKSGKKKNIPIPLVFSEYHFEHSKDTFPIEFIEIIDRHRHLYGKKLFDSLMIDTHHIPLICEREIKSKLIYLRQGLLELPQSQSKIIPFCCEVYRSLIPAIRALVKFKNTEASFDEKEILRSFEALFQIKLNSFSEITHSLKKDLKSRSAFESFLDSFLNDVTCIAKITDKL